jgi:hypothetical protein
MKWIFKLMESLDNTRRQSQSAKATLDGLSPETWQLYTQTMGQIKQNKPWQEIKKTEHYNWFAYMEALKEQANAYDDRTATIRGAGELLVTLLLERLKPGFHTIEGNTYLLHTDLKKRSWFCRVIDDGPGLVFFNRWDNIPPNEGRAATLYEYCELLTDTQFAAQYGTVENPELYT